MKNLIIVAIIAVFAFTFESCKKDDKNDNTTTASTTSTTGGPLADGMTFTSPGSLTLSISHTFGNTPLQMPPASYITDANDTIVVTQLTYYISHVTLTTATGNKVDLGNNSLVEFTVGQNSDITLTNVPAGNYTSISYILGVDSVSNSTGSHTGDLDPSNGMYWAWSTGYVYVRLKGRYGVQNNSYSMDIGGDNNRMNVSQDITSYKVSGTSVTVNIKFDYSKIFNTPNKYDLKVDETDIHNSGVPGIAKLKPNLSGAFSITAIQ